jgi:uncharacterized protein (DUF433 family)
MIEELGWCIPAPPKQELLEFRERLAGALRNERRLPAVPQRKELGVWDLPTDVNPVSSFDYSHEQWLADRSRLAMVALRNCIEISPKKLGGVPVFRGTRFSASQLLAELADSDAIKGISDDFEVKENLLREFLHALAVHLNRPFP